MVGPCEEVGRLVGPCEEVGRVVPCEGWSCCRAL